MGEIYFLGRICLHVDLKFVTLIIRHSFPGRIVSAVKAGLTLSAGGSFLFSTVSSVSEVLRFFPSGVRVYSPRECFF